MKRSLKKLLAMLLTAAMVFSSTPGLTALAVDSGEGQGPAGAPPLEQPGLITGFDALVTEKTVPAGTALAELDLPDALSAQVELDGDATTTDIPVAWDSEPEYDADAPGTYEFTASAEGYTLAAGISWPTVTVTVEQPEPEAPIGIAITGFAPLVPSAYHYAFADAPKTQDALPLPATIEAAAGETRVSVPVIWEAGKPYAGEAGETTFTAIPGEGYTLADGVSAPVITVTVTPFGPGNGGPRTGATVEIQEEQDVTTIQENIQAAIDANPTVTVTGSKTEADETLTLNIPEDKKVVWRATYSAEYVDHPITLPGDGAFEVADGGTVSATEGMPIYATGASSMVTVSGGTVSATASTAIVSMGASSTVTVSGTGKVEASGTAIRTFGNVKVQDAAEVSATTATGYAIYAEGASNTVTVSGGTVSADTGSAIFAGGASSTVTVSGGTVKNEAVTGNKPVIYMSNTSSTGTNVTVSGTGVVQADGAGETAIKSYGSVVVQDSAQVSATTGFAIYAEGASSAVTVSGGTVSTAGETVAAIWTGGESSTVTVSGTGNVQAKEPRAVAIQSAGSVEVQDTAEVSSTTGVAIYATGASSAVEVRGGTVSVTTGMAIFTNGASSTVTVGGGTVSATTGRAITAEGAGSTVTVSGGTVKNEAVSDDKPVIYMNNTSNTGTNVTVSGTGKVEATGMAIRTSGNVEVRDAAEVSADTNRAIYATGASSVVTVSGGTVKSNTITAISTTGANSVVTVSGGTVSSTKGAAIYAGGANSAVTVSGTGVVQTNGRAGEAISIDGTSSTVTVSGTGIVQADGEGGKAIKSYGSVVVQDSAQVSATTGTTIHARGASGTVSVSGGTVSATAGTAIGAEGVNSTVTVSGTGIVQAVQAGGQAINSSGDVEVQGGTVSAKTLWAIYAEGASSTVTVSGGTVSATTGTAIYATGASSTVTVSGGTVFAYRGIISGSDGVIDASAFTGATGDGLVIGWNSTGSGNYALRSEADLVKDPAGAAAYWSTDGEEKGVYYKNGGNEGFIPLNVTVDLISLTENDLSVSIPTSHVYTGERQGIGMVSVSGPHAAYFDETTGGTITVNYDGSATAPTNAGAYAVTAEISGGTEYKAVSIPLGDYIIKAKDLTGATVTAQGSYTYTGAAQTPAEVSVNNIEPIPTADDYTVSATDNINAGMDTATVTITGKNNFTGTASGAFSIEKAPLTVPPQTVKIYKDAASSGNKVDLAALLPANRGLTSYQGTSSNDLIISPSIIDGILTFGTEISADVTAEDITIDVTMQNYKTTTVTVTVSFVDKKVPVVTPTVSGSMFYGQPLSTLRITATAVVDGSTVVSGEIVWDAPATKPAVGAPAQNWTFTPGDTGLYETVTGTSAITVNKTNPSGTPTFTQVTSAGKTLADAALTGSFVNSYDGDAAVSGTLGWDLPDTTAVVQGTAYGWTFTPDDLANYSTRTGTLTPYPSGGGTGGGSGGGGSSGGADSGAPTVTTPIPTEQNPNPATNATTTIKAAVDGAGHASVTVPEESVTAAIQAAQEAAKKAGTTAGGITVTIDVQTDKTASGVTATLPQKAVEALTTAGAVHVTLHSEAVTITLDLATLKAAQTAGSGNLILTASKQDVSALSQAAQTAIGNRPVLNFSLQSGGKAVTSFGGGAVTFAIPYKLQARETAGNIQAVHVDGDGKVTYLTDSRYDEDSRTLIAQTGHFSIFGVGYKADMLEKFTDLQPGAWYSEAVAYAVEHGLFAGTSDTTFSPNAAMTRAMLATVLYRAAGEPDMEDENWGYPFADVDADAYYAAAVYWARQKGITTGTGAETFSPDGSITREQLAVMLYRYAGSPAASGTLDGFTDAHETGGYAADALRWAVEQGIVTGKGGGILDPKGKATRAQVAVMLMRYLALPNS